MSDVIENLWNFRRMSYPKGAHVPLRKQDDLEDGKVDGATSGRRNTLTVAGLGLGTQRHGSITPGLSGPGSVSGASLSNAGSMRRRRRMSSFDEDYNPYEDYCKNQANRNRKSFSGGGPIDKSGRRASTKYSVRDLYSKRKSLGADESADYYKHRKSFGGEDSATRRRTIDGEQETRRHSLDLPRDQSKPSSPGTTPRRASADGALSTKESPQTSAEDLDYKDVPLHPGMSRPRELGRSTKILAGRSTKTYPIPIYSEFHRIVFDFTESKIFSGFILVLILVNTVMLVSQTWYHIEVFGSWIFQVVDFIFLGFYVMEIVLKLYSWRLAFFQEGWNWLDFIIVFFNVFDFLFMLVMQSNAFGGAAIFRLLKILRGIRTLRSLRVLRTIRFLANLQVIMTTILQSIRSIGAIIVLILLFMYIFAVMGREIYADSDPLHFGNIVVSFITLFQLLTLDDWFDIYSTVYKNDPTPTGQLIILYLIGYIVVEYFIFLNLFVAVLVDNFHLTIEAQNEAPVAEESSDDDMDDGARNARESINESIVVEEAHPELSLAPKPIDHYYPDLVREPEKEQMIKMLQITAALEYNMHILHSQSRICDTMVDLCADMGDDV